MGPKEFIQITKNIRVESKKYIQLFIDFAYANLEDLTKTEKGWWIERLQVPLDFADYDEWSIVLSHQRDIRDSLEWLFQKIHTKNEYIQLNPPRSFTTYGRNIKGDRINSFSYGEAIDMGETILIKIYPQYGGHRYTEDAILESRTIHLSFETLLKALNGFPVSSLSKCENCDKIMFNPTKREKKYCSSRCQNTAAVRRHRKKRG